MCYELDHIFICTSVGAPEAQQLIDFGIAEGAPNRHPGQGTANRRFFFENAFLELVWVENFEEAQSELVRPTGLWERWSRRNHGADPFGICLRTTGKATAALPFPAWDYQPSYLPPELSIQMFEHSANASLPLLFFLAFGRRPDSFDDSRRQPMSHPSDVRTITRVSVTSPALSGAPWTSVESQVPELKFKSGEPPLMEVEFDHQHRGAITDFRPNLPLVFCW